MLALEQKVEGMKADFKEGLTEMKQANITLTGLTVITKQMIKDHENQLAAQVEERKENKKRDEKITKNSQISGWLVASVGAIGLIFFGVAAKYITGS